MSLLSVVKQVQVGAQQLKWVTELADELQRIGSLEQAELHAKDRFEKMRAEQKTLTDELAVKRDALAEVAAKQKETETRTGQMLAEVNEMIRGTYKDAEKKAAELVATAKREAEGITQSALASLQDTKERSTRGLRAAEAAEQRVKNATDDLAELEKKIADAKRRAMNAYQEVMKKAV